jgi:hypothetical protein
MTTSRIIDRLLSPTLKLAMREAGAPVPSSADVYRITGIGKGFVWSSQ